MTTTLYIGRNAIGAGAIRPLFLYRPVWSERNALMTNAERDYIIRYRQAGKSCAEISRIMGLSANTVKSFCQRNNIVPIAPNTRVELPALSEAVCLCCGEKVTQQPHRKPKRFCSDACRLRWWHAHRDMEKNAVDRRCFSCGRVFRSSREQKYCSHACYIKSRFGGNAHGRNADARAV